MNTIVKTALVAVAAILAPAPASPHPATEVYIPIGMSPGVSGRMTVTGRIMGYDEVDGTMRVDAQGVERTIALGENVPVYVDRSKARKRNSYGSYRDYHVGRMVEIKVLDGATEWIKVEGD